jgi:hypothetical protein
MEGSTMHGNIAPVPTGQVSLDRSNTLGDLAAADAAPAYRGAAT